MNKVAILLNDKGFKNIDLSSVVNGNPGIGGTEYCFAMLCCYLKGVNEVDATVYHFNDNEYPVKSVKALDIFDAIKKAESDGNDVIILKNLQDEAVYDALASSSLKSIIWCHNFLTLTEIKKFEKIDSIKRVIFVGRQMYDYYIDCLLINKADYIFNMYPTKNMVRREDYDNNVTYIGSLIYEKNFHVLAAAWKDIVAKVPDAKLNVIGTGKLYSKDAVMGPLGIAEKSYEELFVPYLSDEDGKLLDSVIFHGLLQTANDANDLNSKEGVFCNTAVGVANPMAATETFCLCAVEMEDCGVPVVSRRKNSLPDTVKDGKTGLLYKDPAELADYVVRLLKDKELNNTLSKEAHRFASTSFTPETLIKKWVMVIDEVCNNKKAVYHKPDGNMDNNGKWIRSVIHGIHKVPFLRFVPSIHDIQKK